MKVKALPLDAAAFEPYGQVLEANQDGPHRRAFLANIVNGRADAKLNTTFMRVDIGTAPLFVKELERHRFSNQTFVPINGTRHLVAVCPSDAEGKPVVAEIKVFVADGSQSVNYNADVWHAPRQPVGAPGEFVMQRWDCGDADDQEVIPLDEPIEVLGAV